MSPDPPSRTRRRNLQSFLGTLADPESRGAFARAGHVRVVESSFANVLERAGAAAARLRGEGVRPGDRVLILMEDGPGWISAFAACLATGAVAVPLEPSAAPAFVEAVARRCDAKAILEDAGRPAGGASPAVRIPFGTIGENRAGLEPVADPDPDDLAEIVFTSGTTAEPRGVRITHRNILAALSGIEEGIVKRRGKLRLFAPLTILGLVPLSHLFGQALGLFIPAILGARVVFSVPRPARSLLDLAKREKAWVAVLVPRHLAALREHMSGFLPEPKGRRSGRWWLRALRSLPAIRRHGWRLRTFVVGGARLDPELEGWFKDFGYLIVQGYGLTETAPIVSVSNPFDGRTGLLGRPGRVMDVRISEDGEILIRGENVTSGYWLDEAATRSVLDEGWLRTGDLGEILPDGTLRFVGRKKDVIVTAEGQNVFPDEIETALRSETSVHDACVFASRAGAGEAVAAALIPASRDSGTQDALAAAVSAANSRLAPHQRVRSWEVWPHPDFPRTATGKVLRRIVAARTSAPAGEEIPKGEAATGKERPLSGAAAGSDPLDLLRRLAGSEARSDRKLGADLGLSSIDVAELAASIEERFQVEVDPARIDQDATLDDLIRGAPPGGAAAPPWRMPRWATRAPARAARSLLQALVVFPLLRLFVRRHVEGRGHAESAAAPFLVAANHTSHLDVPLLLASLPRVRRRLLAVAMQPEYFEPWLRGTGKLVTRLHMGWHYRLVALLLNTFPFPRSAAFKVALEHAGGLVDRGWSILVFPEGALSLDGEMQTFKSGVGVLSRDLRLDVLPARIRGAFEVLPRGRWFPRRVRAPVTVTWGAPLRQAAGEAPDAFAARIERAIRDL